jgi:hypothetical protein
MARKKREAKLAKLGLDKLRLCLALQTRVSIHDDVVEEYAQAMARGDRFPPVVVFQDEGESILADGFHRLKAAQKARLKHLDAEVRQGSRKDALRFALGANDTHGLRRTNRDKRRAVEMALAEFANLSDHLLAEMCGVSVPTVGTVRNQLEIFNSCPRLGKDGKSRALPIRGVNGSARPAVDRGGGANLDPDEGGEAFREVAEALAALESLVERVAKQHPKNRAAIQSVIERVRRDLLNLAKRLATDQ